MATVLSRAASRLGDQDYRVFGDDGEHFAVWCKTGRHVLTQIDSLREAARPLGSTWMASTWIVHRSRYLPPRSRPLVYGTAVAVTAGCFLYRYAKLRWANVARRES